MNEQIKNGGPAFPVDTSGSGHEPDSGEFGHQTSNSTWQFSGMTLRDYFAAKALEGIMANPERWKQIADDYISGRKSYEQCSEANATKAFSLADAMLRAREVQS